MKTLQIRLNYSFTATVHLQKLGYDMTEIKSLSDLVQVSFFFRLHTVLQLFPSKTLRKGFE